MAEGINHLETRDIGAMPGPGSGKMSNKSSLDNMSYRCIKADVDDASDMAQLCDIKTRALQAKPGEEDIILLNSDKFTFMDKYFMILEYLERN